MSFKTYVLILSSLYIAMSCRPNSGPNDYASQEIITDVGVPVELELAEGEERLSLSIFYEGEYTEQVVIDDINAHFYIYENTFSLSTFEGDRKEGLLCDRIHHAGGPWWGGGVHWETPKDLSRWTTLHISLKSTSNTYTSLELAMNNGDSQQVKVSLSDYGFKTDGEWYALEIPLQDLVDSGLDVTQVTAPLVLIGQSGETGDILLVDAVYLNQQ